MKGTSQGKYTKKDELGIFREHDHRSQHFCSKIRSTENAVASKKWTSSFYTAKGKAKQSFGNSTWKGTFKIFERRTKDKNLKAAQK